MFCKNILHVLFCTPGCFQAPCSPVFKGKMCTSDDLQKCCFALCTFKQVGNARAMYDIQEITHIALGTPSTCAEERFTTLPDKGYLRNKVVANPVGNTCPVEGTCDLYQCANVIEQHDNHVFINEDYVTMVQTVTRSQSPSVSFSTHLFNFFPFSTNSVSLGQSMLAEKCQAATVSKSGYTTVLPSQTPHPTVFNYDKTQYLYAMLGGILAAGILCVIFIVLTITGLIFRCRRGESCTEHHKNLLCTLSRTIS